MNMRKLFIEASLYYYHYSMHLGAYAIGDVIDLHRTFPDNDHFSCAVVGSDGSVTMDPDSNPKLRALRRVLLAFSVYAPQIGYCQSLNYLAGFFLLFVGEEEGGEEAAFWMLITTVHDYFPENMYDVTMEGAHIDQSLLMLMVYERMPEVWNKIGGGKDFWECIESEGLPPVTLVTSHWFLTMFINILPVEVASRLICIFSNNPINVDLWVDRSPCLGLSLRVSAKNLFLVTIMDLMPPFCLLVKEAKFYSA